MIIGSVVFGPDIPGIVGRTSVGPQSKAISFKEAFPEQYEGGHMSAILTKEEVANYVLSLCAIHNRLIDMMALKSDLKRDLIVKVHAEIDQAISILAKASWK